MDNAQRTESLKRMVECVDNDHIVLPEFQRDFVWEVSKTHELFDSLVRDIFIGTIIYGIPSFDITTRELDNRPRKRQGKRRKALSRHTYTLEQVNSKVKTSDFRLLLDGQQRTTSIYRALKGSDKVYFVCKNLDELDSSIQSKDNVDRQLEDLLFAFTGKEDRARLSISMAFVWSIARGDISRESQKIHVLRESSYFNTIPTGSDQEDAIESYLQVLDKLDDFIKAEKLVSYYLLDTTEEKFALFFERSNSKGVRLSFIDILTAKLYAGFKLRDATRSFNQDHSTIGLNVQIVVRSIAFIASGGKAVGQTYILKELNYSHFIDHWDNITGAYVKTIEWLFDNRFMISQGWLTYDNMIIPLIMFLREIKANEFSQLSKEQSEFIEFWYWNSVFSQRYSAASNETIIKDCKVLIEFARTSTIPDRQFFYEMRANIDDAEDIMNLTSKRSSLYSGVLNLMNYKAGGFVDLRNGNKLSISSRLEDHHIFPVRYLRNTLPPDHEESELIDSVGNRTIVPKITNISIAAKQPSKYLQQIKLVNPDLSNALTSHVIPAPDALIDGTLDDDYSSFLVDRSESMFSIVKAQVIDKLAVMKSKYTS